MTKKEKTNKKIVISYVPVLHKGYFDFFNKHKDADTIYVLGEDLISEFTHLSKEIRQLDPEVVRKSLLGLGDFSNIEILDKKSLGEIGDGVLVVMPDEDVMHDLKDMYLSKNGVIFDKVFLRWDKHSSMAEKPVEADQKISKDEFDREVISKLKEESEKSSDWWRRIASAIVKDGEIVLMAHNEHLPSPHSPYVEGDPRNNFHKGIGIEYSTSIHSEARLVAEAARRGISLEGTSMYASTFPCPICAKQIAFSGIKKLYYTGGYSVLDQEKILKSRGVEIIFVDLEN